MQLADGSVDMCSGSGSGNRARAFWEQTGTMGYSGTNETP